MYTAAVYGYQTSCMQPSSFALSLICLLRAFATAASITHEARQRAQVGVSSNAAMPAGARRLQEATDAAALDALCGEPIARANLRYCTALLRTLARCRADFGRFTLRCSRTGATACSTSLAEIRNGRCGAHPSAVQGLRSQSTT